MNRAVVQQSRTARGGSGERSAARYVGSNPTGPSRLTPRSAAQEKARQLGMPFGTAMGRLRKIVLFGLLCKLKENRCFVCRKPITKANDLTIEHRRPWMYGDPALFWDQENIAFSHHACNRPHRPARGQRHVAPSGQSWCGGCQVFKPIAAFARKKARWNGVHTYCRSCNAAASKLSKRRPAGPSTSRRR